MAMGNGYHSLIGSLERLGVGAYKVVAITSDLAALGSGIVETKQGLDDLAALLAAIQSAMKPDATVVVPTFTYERSGPGSSYVHDSTPSETGTLTEHIRQLPDSTRSIHPVFSFAAIGPEKDAICLDTSGHSYGWGSPAYRLLESDALVISLGRSLHRGAFLIHHAEMLAGVPYRYTKTLSIPVWVNGELSNRSYFHFVKYQDSDIEWNTNRLVERMEARKLVRFEPYGQTGIWAYRARDLIAATVQLLGRNIYGLLSFPPAHRPWER